MGEGCRRDGRQWVKMGRGDGRWYASGGGGEGLNDDEFEHKFVIDAV